MNSNLLFSQMVPCAMIDKTTTLDSYGSVKTIWVQGAQFKAFLRLDNSLEAKVAQKAQGISYVTVVTPYNMILHVNDVIQRLSDSKIFRITSDSDDYNVPEIASSGMKVKKATAEEWMLPND